MTGTGTARPRAGRARARSAARCSWPPPGSLAALPEAPLVAAAETIGELWYRIAPARAAQARANLRRVCEGLAAQGRGRAARPARRHRPGRARAARPGLLPPRGPLLPRGRADRRLDVERRLAQVVVETPDESARRCSPGGRS